MSTRAHHRRQQRADARAQARHQHRHGLPDGDVGTTIGWCEAESDLAETQQVTHDTLIELMGDRRTSGVAWIRLTGPDAIELVDVMAQDATGEHAAYYREIRHRLVQFGGWVVVAYADGIVP